MTLPELERLVSRIEEAMERPPAEGVLPKLAADYNAVARAAIQRLQQCAAMIAAGDDHQALQLAEAQPPLLDQFTLLSFCRSPGWRALCRSENLPAPENFEIKPIRQLNELYAKGIDKDHALYREYRRAVMLNDDVRALAVLRSITRLNGNDQNARKELDRLEHKFISDKIHRLEKLVREKAPAPEIAALAEELETIPHAQQSAAWIPAQTIRGTQIIGAAREAQRSGAADELQQLLRKTPAIAHLLNESDRKSLDELERWSAADTVRRKEAAGRRAAINELAQLVARLETNPPGQLQELRSSAEALDRAWRQVEQFRAEIAGDLAARAQKLRDTLRIQIERALSASRRLAFAVVAAVVAICLSAGWLAYRRQAANVLANRLQIMIVERRVTEAETALANSSGLSSPSFKNSRELAASFIQRERALKTAADQSFAPIEAAAQMHFTNAAPEKIAAQFQSAKNAVAALAPEFRSATDATFVKSDAAWHEFLDRERNAITQRLNSLIQPIEAAANRDLQYTRNSAEIIATASSLKTNLESLRPLVQAPVAELRPKQETLFRFENLSARIEKFSRDASNWSTAQTQLAVATNLTSYNNALQLLATNGFTPDTQRSVVNALAAQNLTDEKLLAPLLLPNGPAALLTEPPRVSRLPDDVLPAERDLHKRLREDENIHAVSRLEIEIKNLPAENPRRRRTVYLRGELQRRVTRRAGQIYDPIEGPTTLQFTMREMSSTDYTVEEPTPTPERELYRRASLDRLLDSNTGKYQINLLQSLDEINHDRAASPLFRAWLFLRVCEIMDLQPTQWGAEWSPAFAADRAGLDRLGARQIQSGDWFIPARAAQRAPGLNAHFDRAALHSYVRQSAYFKRLLPKAAQAGARVVGYINAAGEPILNDHRALGAIWGLTAANQPAQVILNSVSANTDPERRASAMPYSPLLVFGGNPSELVDSTLQSLGFSGAAVGLPESLPLILWPAPTP